MSKMTINEKGSFGKGICLVLDQSLPHLAWNQHVSFHWDVGYMIWEKVNGTSWFLDCSKGKQYLLNRPVAALYTSV